VCHRSFEKTGERGLSQEGGPAERSARLGTALISLASRSMSQSQVDQLKLKEAF
jgi:hypothetical protein